MDLGVRTWGNSATGSVVLLTGTYTTDGEVSRRLLDALAPLTVFDAGSWQSPIVPLLADEITRDEPGQQVVLDRLLDLLLVAALRAAFARPGAEVPAWYRAFGDPVVGRALRLMHNAPAHPWTVASLAAARNSMRPASPSRSMSSAISFIVLPSGTVTKCTNTRPAANFRNTSAGVSGRSKKYSPACSEAGAFHRQSNSNAKRLLTTPFSASRRAIPLFDSPRGISINIPSRPNP